MMCDDMDVWRAMAMETLIERSDLIEVLVAMATAFPPDKTRQIVSILMHTSLKFESFHISKVIFDFERWNNKSLNEVGPMLRNMATEALLDKFDSDSPILAKWEKSVLFTRPLLHLLCLDEIGIKIAQFLRLKLGDEEFHSLVGQVDETTGLNCIQFGNTKRSWSSQQMNLFATAFGVSLHKQP